MLNNVLSLTLLWVRLLVNFWAVARTGKGVSAAASYMLNIENNDMIKILNYANVNNVE